jgi:hypothetical protein
MDEVIDDRLQAYDDIEDMLDTRLEQVQLLFGDNYQAQARIYNQKAEAHMGKLVSINEAIEAKQATVKALENMEVKDKELSEEQRKELRDARKSITELQKQQMETETALLQDIRNELESRARDSAKKMVNGLFSGNDVN